MRFPLCLKTSEKHQWYRFDHSLKCSSFHSYLILTKIKVISKLGEAQVMRFQASGIGQEEAKANWILLDNPRLHDIVNHWLCLLLRLALVNFLAKAIQATFHHTELKETRGLLTCPQGHGKLHVFSQGKRKYSVSCQNPYCANLIFKWFLKIIFSLSIESWE